MKKILIMLLILCVAVVQAAAETREGELLIEGEPEQITETLYHWAEGISFWYDASVFAVDGSVSEHGGSLLIEPVETDMPIYLELLTAKSIGMSPQVFLEENAGEDAEWEEETTETNLPLYYFSARAAYNPATAQIYYAVGDEEFSVAAVATCPMEAMEGWGARFTHLMRTIGFDGHGMQPIRADWVDDTDALGHIVETVRITTDELAGWVVLTAAERVTDFQLLALEGCMDDDGVLTFAESLLYQRGTLAAGEAIKAAVRFEGDIPNIGIRYTDAAGDVRQYTLSISGRDGTLALTPY